MHEIHLWLNTFCTANAQHILQSYFCTCSCVLNDMLTVLLIVAWKMFIYKGILVKCIVLFLIFFKTMLNENLKPNKNTV